MFFHNSIQLLLHKGQMPRAALALVTALTLLITLPSQAAATTTCGPVNARDAVLVVHGGGWIGGSSANTHWVCQFFGHHGYRAVNIDYPLYDVNKASLTVILAAKLLKAHYGRVFAYGESAGGTMVATAAALQQVDRAYAWAPVSDLLRWRFFEAGRLMPWQKFRDASIGALWRNSPLAHASSSSAPLHIDHGRHDRVVPATHTLRLARQWPVMTYRLLSGGHIFTRSSAGRPSSALRYFKKQ